MRKWLWWAVPCSFLPSVAIYLFLWPSTVSVGGLVDVTPPPIVSMPAVQAVNSSCLWVESADLKADKLTFVTRNVCQHELSAPFYVYRITVGGVSVVGNRFWFNGDKVFMPGERRLQPVTIFPPIEADGAVVWLNNGVGQ